MTKRLCLVSDSVLMINSEQSSKTGMFLVKNTLSQEVGGIHLYSGYHVDISTETY